MYEVARERFNNGRPLATRHCRYAPARVAIRLIDLRQSGFDDGKFHAVPAEVAEVGHAKDGYCSRKKPRPA
jgi:hypothetical protein